MSPQHPQLALAFPVKESCQFSRFEVEEGNAILLHALQEIEAGQGALLYLWGAAGSGKTHLLQALCLEHQDSVFLPISDLLQLSPDLLSGLESLALVCVDDVHLLAGRPDWQERLFVLFNRLREAGGNLVISGNAPPTSLSLELDDLRSRLQWGLVYQVQELGDAGKLKVLKRLAEDRGIRLTDELASYILQRAERDMPSLLALLDRLDSLSLIEKRRITQAFVRQIMGW